MNTHVKVYGPCILLVVISWVSFWINRKINIKQKARNLIDKLPDNSTWDDLMYEIYVRQAIEAGLADSEAEKVISVAEVRTKFKLEP